MNTASAWTGEAEAAESWGLPEVVDQPRAKLPLALKFILVTLFFPPETSFFIGDIRLTLERVVLLGLAPLVFSRFLQAVASGRYRFVASDLFVCLASLWMFIGPGVTDGIVDSLKHSGPVVLEYLIPYFATRILLIEPGQPVAFVSWLCIAIGVVSLDALLDTLTGRYFTHELFLHLAGHGSYYYNVDEFRHGLLRASGTLEHPILFGFVSAIGLLYATAIRMPGRKFSIATCALGVLTCISSAPQQSAIMGLGLLAYARMFARFPGRWSLIWIPSILIAVILFTSTPTPFGHLFDVLTISPDTAYYRLYIWNIVGPAILDNPWFSVAGSSYDYQGSVDSVWLMLALSYGMPCGIFVALSMIGCCSLPTSPFRSRLTEQESQLGLVSGIVIFLTIYMGFTVHFWGATWILIGLLVGLRARLGELGRLRACEDPDAV